MARRRNADLLQFAQDRARADFELRYPGATLGPIVAVIAAYNEEGNIGDVLKVMPTLLR